MVGTTQAANLLGISPRRLRHLLQEGRVHGAFKVGRTWVIPLVNGLPVITTKKKGPQSTWRQTKHPTLNYVHVNSKLFGKKDVEGNYVPAITVKSGSENTYCHRVVIPGSCTVVYAFENALSAGAKSWIETYSTPIFVGETYTYGKIQASLAKAA
ncbi:MAG: helix-turn-helix domain-containing protein [Nostocaceae cyanobacterium]|nr:helix-turn-helix domain-containing protein [Nostocaceae cyanobacterium]